MIDFDGILKNAIVSITGVQGYEKFLKERGTAPGKMLNAQREPDVHEIINVLLDIFPEDRAAAITDRVLIRYREEQLTVGQAALQIMQTPAVPVKAPVPDAPVAVTPACSQNTARSNLARFSNSYSSEIDDVINEAISLRKSMGKPLHNFDATATENPVPVNNGAGLAMPAPDTRPVPAIIGIPVEMPGIVTVPGFNNPGIPPVSVSDAGSVPPAEITPEMLNKEITEFLLRQDSLSGINSTDFSMYLKGKGYTFEEKPVLEQLYTMLEQRKARVRAWILQDIAVFLSQEKWPSEEKVQIFIQKLRADGIVYDDSEIKRMVVTEMMRKI